MERRIEYGFDASANDGAGQPDAPVLAVKLQELFGLADTPRIADGRVPLTLHLLSPGGKPLQITQDLRSFWDRTYPEVKKEMKGRYPKHPWPDDPWSRHRHASRETARHLTLSPAAAVIPCRTANFPYARCGASHGVNELRRTLSTALRGTATMNRIDTLSERALELAQVVGRQRQACGSPGRAIGWMPARSWAW